MNCPRCATENPEGAKFCLNCGTSLAVTCPQCGAALPPQARFCFECGTPLGAPQEEGQPPEQDAIAARLQRLVPKEYAERLLATRGQMGHERRVVTILFSDVKGSTAMAERLDPEEVLEIMDGAFDVLIEPVYRHEGTLARLMGDAVLAFFGAPIAHEDDPERACRAALEITAGARRYSERLERERGIRGFNVRVGIHTGLVVVGEVGSDLRVEYTAMGDAINLAARMEQNAPPGGILISRDTYRHVRGVFDVEPQAPLHVKGKAEPVETYLVEAAKARAFRKPLRGVEGIETRMVGRDAELKHLQEAFYVALEEGELQMVTVCGEAGVGKSRLLHEFDVWAELWPQQFYYFKARAFPEMQNLPYGLVRNLVAFRFQILESDPADVVREKLEAGVGVALGDGGDSQAEPQVALRAHLIGRLLGFETGDSPHLAAVQGDAQAMRDQALEVLSAYFRGIARQFPVLVLLEDLHWADDSSLDALNYLALALRDQPLMVAGAARPALFERRPHWGEGRPFHSRLELQSLSKWDSRHLVAEILQKVTDVPQTLRDLIVTGAEGNPFFIEELVKMLVEDGVIIKGEEAWCVAPDRLAGVRVPPTLTGVLQARVDRLLPEERTVLQMASVVGRLFWDRAVARINASAEGGIEEAEIQNNLSALRSREMVFQRETSAFADAQEYLFKHNMLREVAYESVLKRVRRVYHGLVADWLLEQSGERLEEHTALIADHLELAGRTAEAVGYLLQAGDRARDLYAHQEAIGAYERALALLKAEEEDTRAARTLMKLGLTYHTAFDFHRSRQAYEEGFALWQRVSQAQPVAPPPPAPHGLRESWGDVTSLDPMRTEVTYSALVTMHLFSGLVELTPGLDVVPDVARSWEVLDGGRRYIFHLREDAIWSDGVPVTAWDFEYAWQRILDPSAESPIAKMLFDVRGARAFHEGQGRVQGVEVRVLDERTLVVGLERPAGYFLQLLAHPLSHAVPRHVVEAHGEAWTEPENMVANGPFRLASWQPGESLVLERRPTYHGRFSGNLQRVELSLRQRIGLEPLELYEAGSLDVLDLGDVPVPERERARQVHAGEIVSAVELTTHWLSFFPTGPPLDDVRVRRALVLATDRETLAQVVRGGYEFPATGGLVPPGMPGHSPGIGLPYDPELARQLLAEAGYAGGQGFPPVDAFLWAPWHTDTPEYLTTQWYENLGIEIAWERVDLATRVREFQRGQLGEPHLFLSGWIADYPDPDNFLRLAGLTTMPAQWSSLAYKGLIERAGSATSQAERLKLYRQADRLIIEEAVVMPLTYGRRHLLLKPWVARYPVPQIASVFWKDVVLEPH